MAEIIQLRCDRCGFQWTEDLDDPHENDGRCPHGCDESAAKLRRHLPIDATTAGGIVVVTCSCGERIRGEAPVSAALTDYSVVAHVMADHLAEAVTR